VDLAVDPQNRPPLKPFVEVARWFRARRTFSNRLDGGTGGRISAVAGSEAYSTGQPQGQAPGGYHHALGGARAFIFMNASASSGTWKRFLHEATATRFTRRPRAGEDLYAYRGAPIEFCEVASMAMELLGNEFLEEFYPPPRLVAARKRISKALLAFSVDGGGGCLSALDSHARKLHARRSARPAYVELMDRFGGDVTGRVGKLCARTRGTGNCTFHPPVLLRRNMA